MNIIKKLLFKFRSFYFRFKQKWGREKTKKFRQHDERLVQKLSDRKKLPSWRQLTCLSEYLSKNERLVLRIVVGMVIVAACCLLINIYWTHSSLQPQAGGNYTEALIGAPRYVNPLFSNANDVDADLASLVYSGLLKYSDQGLIKDLTQDYQISEDQKTYTFQLRQDIVWHNGERLDADDVIFTFSRIKNPQTKTPLYYNFQGADIAKIDDYAVQFTLSEAFAPFLESLTVGILPRHIWQNILPENMMMAEYNLKPIGSGPFRFKSLLKNKNGAVRSFNLQKNAAYYQNAPYIDEITFKFYETFESAIEALNNKNVEGVSYLPKEIRSRIINNRNLNFQLLNLPQYTAVFFNYDKSPILKDLTLRKILTHAVDREKIVNEILNAEAQIINSCILPGSLGYTPDIAQYPFDLEHARNELEKISWQLAEYETTGDDSENAEATEPDVAAAEQYPYPVRKKQGRYLEFTLTTVDQPENVKIARALQQDWQQINAKVNLKIVSADQIQEIIKARDYEALLYGQILGYDPDPYPFWHSSQRSYPGLNLTSLNNPDIDKLLSDARHISDDADRAEKYLQFQKKLAEAVPAIFLFNPTYTYPQNKKIKGFGATKIINPANRFNQVNEWFIKTDRRWLRK